MNGLIWRQRILTLLLGLVSNVEKISLQNLAVNTRHHRQFSRPANYTARISNDAKLQSHPPTHTSTMSSHKHAHIIHTEHRLQNFITFCIRRSRGEMYIGHRHLCVRLFVPCHIPTLLHEPGCKLGEW